MFLSCTTSYHPSEYNLYIHVYSSNHSSVHSQNFGRPPSFPTCSEPNLLHFRYAFPYFPSPQDYYILGYNGNEYCINITRTSITCNCPNTSLSCKHILVILFYTGFIKPDDQYVTIRLMVVILSFHNPLLSCKLKPFNLDHHTNYLCTTYHHSSCHYCPQPIFGIIIICSKCVFFVTKFVYNFHPTISTHVPRAPAPLLQYSHYPLRVIVTSQILYDISTTKMIPI